MTIAEFLGKFQPSEKPQMMELAEIWSNDAARGYAIAAMEEAGMDRAEIEKVLPHFHGIFDELSVDEAAKKYIHY